MASRSSWFNFLLQSRTQMQWSFTLATIAIESFLTRRTRSPQREDLPLQRQNIYVFMNSIIFKVFYIVYSRPVPTIQKKTCISNESVYWVLGGKAAHSILEIVHCRVHCGRWNNFCTVLCSWDLSWAQHSSFACFVHGELELLGYQAWYTQVPVLAKKSIFIHHPN